MKPVLLIIDVLVDYLDRWPSADRAELVNAVGLHARPSVKLTPTCGATRASARAKISRVAALAIGAMNVSPGRRSRSQAAVAAKSREPIGPF